MTSSRLQNNRLSDWPEPKQFKSSLRTQFSIYLSVLILILMSITGYVITSRYVETVTSNIVTNLLMQARAYSGPAGKLIISTTGPDALLLNNICKKLANDNEDVFWAGITDQENIFLAHTEIKNVFSSKKLELNKSNRYSELLDDGETFAIIHDTIFISVPIKENNLLIGRLGVASSYSPVAVVQKKSIVTVTTITLIVLIIGLPLITIVLGRKLKPLSIITDHLKKITPGNIKLDIPINEKNEFGYLAETLKVMGSKLNDAHKEMIEQERISREFEIASEIQANILPKSYPSGDSFEFSGIYKSAKEVGGDYYDFIDVDKDHIGVVIADVSGKSLPGMLVMLLTRDMVKNISRTTKEPTELLSEVNSELRKNIKKGMFVTMFYGLLNKKTGEFRYASAGHNPLIVIKSSGKKTELQKTKGFPLGMMSDELFNKRIESGVVNMSENDWLVQFTDGVNEAINESNEEFGMDRFVKILEESKSLSPQKMVESTIKRHSEFIGNSEQYDDITLLVLKWTGKTVDTSKYDGRSVTSVS